MAFVSAAAISIILLYFLTKSLFSKQTAIISTIIFASSHYLLAFAHVGYNNLNALIPTLLAFMYLTRSIPQSTSKLNPLLSGAFSGLGFYTFYSARLTFFIILVFLFLKPIRNFRKLLYFIFGFLLLFIPFYLVNRQDVFTFSLMQTTTHPEFAGFQYKNALYTFTSLFSSKFIPIGHFVSGSLLDPLSSFFLLIASFIVVKKINKEKYQLLFLWVVVGVILISGLFYKLGVPTTRLHFILPALSILVGLGLSILTQNTILVAIFLGIIIFLNLYRFYIQTPKVHHNTRESLIIKVLQENPDKRVYHLSSTPIHPILLTAISSYGFSNRYMPIGKLSQLPKEGILVSYEEKSPFIVSRQFDYSGKSFIYVAKF